ncbi:MAG: aminotransferase class IV [Longimicrobiales bacterium]
MIVYLDGAYLPHDEARVAVDDRGFLFGDGVYEVIRVRAGRPVAMTEHLQRMTEGLAALRIELEDPGSLATVAARLLEQNRLLDGDVTIYIQVTRGSAPRRHAFPDCEPTVYARAAPYTPHPDSFFTDGVAAITVGDDRWARCDIKSTSLLANVLANQRAHEAGAFEALFVRDGVVIEGSHSNLFAVFDGQLVTYPASNYILDGITRRQVFGFAARLGILAREGLIPLDRLWHAEELFLSGTTTEIMPIVRVDGRKILDGEPGPVTQKLLREYREMVGE